MKWTLSRGASALATAVVASLGLSGCIKTDDKTTLEKDGSGTADITVSMDLSKMKQMKEMFGAMMPQAPTPAPTTGPDGKPVPAPEPKKEDDVLGDYSKEKVEAELKAFPGNELKAYSREEKDGQSIVNMTVAFTSYENFLKAGTGGNKAVTLVKNADGTYTMTMDAAGGEMDAGSEGAAGAEMMMPMLEPFMSGMEMKTTVTFPGEVTETTGTKSEDGMTVAWTVAWKDMSAAMKEKKKDALVLKVTFDGEGVDLKPFSFKPDKEKAASRAGFGGK